MIAQQPVPTPPPTPTSPRTDVIADGSLRAVLTLATFEFATRAVYLADRAYLASDAGHPSTYDYDGDHAPRFLVQAWANAVETGGAYVAILTAIAAWILFRRSERWIVHAGIAVTCLIPRALSSLTLAIAPFYWERDARPPRMASFVGSDIEPLLHLAGIGLVVFILADGSRDRLRTRAVIAAAGCLALQALLYSLHPASPSATVIGLVAFLAAAVAVTLSFAIRSVDRSAPPTESSHPPDAADRAARAARALGLALGTRLAVALAITTYIRQTHVSRAEEQLLAYVALAGSLATDVWAAYGFFRLTAVPGSATARARAARSLALVAILLGADLRTFEVFFGQHGYGVDRPFWFAQAALVAVIASFASVAQRAASDRGIAGRARLATWGSRLLVVAVACGLFAQWNNRPAASAQSAMAFGILAGGASFLIGFVLTLLAARGLPTLLRSQPPLETNVTGQVGAPVSP